MICAAMGKDWADVGILAELNSIGMTIFVFEQGGRLTDFHTVGGGYDREGQAQYIPHTAEGKLRPEGKETVPTQREFLEDTKFGVILEGSARLTKRIALALVDPVWGVWFGRKSCIPAMPICSREIYGKQAEAEAQLRNAAGDRGVRRIVREVTDLAEGTDTLADRPLDFKKRDFAPRRVAVEEIPDADLRKTSA
jgi:CRISPR system Cascade subunit CasD